MRAIDAAFSARCLTAAEKAYAAAKANPALFAPAADGTGGGAYDDDNVTDEFYWAAAELYATTGEQAYRNRPDLLPAVHGRQLHPRAPTGAGRPGWRHPRAGADRPDLLRREQRSRSSSRPPTACCT